MNYRIYTYTLIILIGTYACTTQNKIGSSTENDDLYFTRKDKEKKITESNYNEAAKNSSKSNQPGVYEAQNNSQNNQGYHYSSQDVDFSKYYNNSNTSNSGANTTTGGNTYVTNNYYYDNDVFFGRTRRRWYTPVYFSSFYCAYNPWFNPIWSPVWSMSLGYSVGWGWYTGWGWSTWCGYNPFYPFTAGWGWYDPFYDPFWVYRGYYYPINYPVSPWAYYYWSGYNTGFQNGYYFCSITTSGINRPFTQIGPRKNNPGIAYGRMTTKNAFHSSSPNSFGPRTTSANPSTNSDAKPTVVNKYTSNTNTPDSYGRPNLANTNNNTGQNNYYSRPRIITNGNNSRETNINHNTYSQPSNSIPYDNNAMYTTPRSVPDYGGRNNMGGSRKGSVSGFDGSGSFGKSHRNSSSTSKPRVR